ncbi:MAG: ABC transporter permease subunit, partial [Candidatus Micrarchaeota archaeon]|nr:ABC transporter permease subunit [Candidatus Micrarchaeota archaeon]
MGFPATIALDIAASWVRLLIALLVSIIFSIIVGIAAATNRTLERIILPVLDVLQTIPILGFFPIVILVIVSAIPGYAGVNTAVIFLIFTSMSWNISFGVYEAVKAIPQEINEIASLYRFSFLERVRRIYIPSALPRIAYQSSLSFSIGIFYLATSEIFSTGSNIFAVTNGIGVEIANIASQGSFPPLQYLAVIMAFVAAVIVTRLLILEPFLSYSERFSLAEKAVMGRRSRVLGFYTEISSVLRKALRRVIPRRRRRQKQVPIPLLPQVRKQYRLVRHKHFKHIYATIIVLLAVLAIALLMNTSQVPTEIAVLLALGASFLRVWGTYLVSAAIAVPLGILISQSRRLFSPILSILQVVAAIPATILLPALIALLAGTPYFGESTAFAVIFISMIWYLLFSV